MKTIKHLLFAAMLPFMALSLNSCTDYQDELDALDYRVTVLENLVNKMNTDMEAMEIIIDAMANSDYITNVTQSSEGYIITFNNSGAIVIHDGDRVADGDSCQAGTFVESKVADGGDRVGDDDAVQSGAVFECRFADGRDRVANGDACQAGTFVESFVADG